MVLMTDIYKQEMQLGSSAYVVHRRVSSIVIILSAIQKNLVDVLLRKSGLMLRTDYGLHLVCRGL